MIYLTKILPLFFLPTGVAFALIGAGLVLRRRALCWTGLALIWIASTPVVSDQVMRAAEGWQVRGPAEEATSAHAIVVLSYGRMEPPGVSGVSEWQDPDRFFGGVELFMARKAPLLVFTGGWLPWISDAQPEGEILARFARRLGVPSENIAITTRASNTAEESRATRQLLLERLGPGVTPRVLLVTSAFHMRRARMQLSRAGVEVIPFPVDFKVRTRKSWTVMDLLPNSGALSQTETALREFYGFAFYRIAG